MTNDEQKFIGSDLSTEVCEEELHTVRIISSATTVRLIKVALQRTIFPVAY